MDEIIAYCGLVCSDCPAWRATRDGDDEALAGVAALWSKQFGIDFAPDDCRCTGCIGEERPQISFIAECRIRKCAMGRGLDSCARCDDYPCKLLQKWFENVPESRERLEAIRRDQA